MRKHKFTILFIIYACLVITLSSIPNIPTPELPDKISPDKIAHFTQYFIFAFLYFKFRESRGGYKKDILIELFFLGILISILNELYQICIPGRTFSWWDTLANLFGFLSWIGLYLIKNKRGKNENNQHKKGTSSDRSIFTSNP